jgi:hypothetical protein
VNLDLDSVDDNGAAPEEKEKLPGGEEQSISVCLVMLFDDLDLRFGYSRTNTCFAGFRRLQPLPESLPPSEDLESSCDGTNPQRPFDSSLIAAMPQKSGTGINPRTGFTTSSFHRLIEIETPTLLPILQRNVKSCELRIIGWVCPSTIVSPDSPATDVYIIIFKDFSGPEPVRRFPNEPKQSFEPVNREVIR